MEERAVGREQAHHGVGVAFFDYVMCCVVRDFTGDERGMKGERYTLTKMTVVRKISLQRIRGGQRSTESWTYWRRIERRCRSRRCTRRSLRESSPVYWNCYSSRTSPRNKQLMRLLLTILQIKNNNSTPRSWHQQLLILLTVIN